MTRLPGIILLRKKAVRCYRYPPANSEPLRIQVSGPGTFLGIEWWKWLIIALVAAIVIALILYAARGKPAIPSPTVVLAMPGSVAAPSQPS